jgi:type III restriction enzyme
VEEWLEGHLECVGDGATMAMLQYVPIADRAAELIHATVMRAAAEDGAGRGRSGGPPPVMVDLDPYSPRGTTADVDFQTSKKTRWHTTKLCHLNMVVCDQEWERGACRFFEEECGNVLAYVKNYRLGFEVPYSHQGELKHCWPDFIVRLDDGRGAGDPLNLVLEVKGQRDDCDAAKKDTIENYWVPGVNALKTFGRWAFCEVTDPYRMGDALDSVLGGASGRLFLAEG